MNLRLLLAGVVLVLQATSANAGSLPENAVVVVNADSWASTRIANEYVRLRGVPPANVIYVSGITDFERLGVEQFRQQILLPVLKTIEARGLAGQIDYVLYSADFPTAISVGDDVGDRKLPRVITPVASINGLTFLYQQVLAKDIRYLDLAANHYARRIVPQSQDSLSKAEEQQDLKQLRERTDFQAVLGKMRERRFDLEPAAGFSALSEWPAGSGSRYLLSTMLACTSGRGNSVHEAIEYLRRSAAADGTHPSGTIYFLQNGDVRSTTREWAFREAVEQLQQLGIKAAVESGVLPQNKSDVAGAVIGSAGFDWSQCGSTILPGAIVEHLTSCGGEMPETAGQTPLSEFLRYGAAAASGTVTEPYAIQAKFPTPFLHLYYANGCTLGEAFYQALAGPYQLLIVGDALCKPWSPKIELTVDGLKPRETVRNTVKITPHANTAGDAVAVLYELYVNGRRIAQLQPGQSLDLDTAQLADGCHEMTWASHSSTPVNPQGRLAFPITVANGTATLQVTGPGGAEIPWNQPFELAANLAGAREIVFTHQTRPIGRIAGSAGRVTIDPRVLGQGPVRLQPIGLLEGATPRSVFAPPLDLTIVPPPPLPAIQPPPDQQRSPGFRVTVPDKTPAVIERISPELLAGAGLERGRSFTVEAYFQVSDDDVYQFQIRGHANIRSLAVDGHPQDWPRGGTWWFLPTHLAPGDHQLRIEGEVTERADFEIRFGGRGVQRLDAKRQPMWTCPK